MGSTRLPGKSMMPLAGEPLIFRLLERLKLCSQADAVVLAVPDTPDDDCLESVARDVDVVCVRGSESNLLERHIQAAAEVGAEIVVRIPGDNPVPAPSEIDRIIKHHAQQQQPNFATNICSVFGSGYPDGIGAEVIDTCLLEDASNRTPTTVQLEHVHRNFFDYESGDVVDSAWCPVSTIDCPVSIRSPDVRLDVNTDRDYELMSAMYEDLYPEDPHFTTEAILAWLRSRSRG